MAEYRLRLFFTNFSRRTFRNKIKFKRNIVLSSIAIIEEFYQRWKIITIHKSNTIHERERESELDKFPNKSNTGIVRMQSRLRNHSNGQQWSRWFSLSSMIVQARANTTACAVRLRANDCKQGTGRGVICVARACLSTRATYSNESTERIPVIREVSTDFSSRFSSRG